MATAIEFDHVGKQYRLGLVSMGTLGNDLKRWWTTSILRKEDPFLTVGEVNDRSVKGDSEYVWALKDIDFKVEQGDVVGIIGRNGAGKSTLLKLLSRVTGPTVGEIRARGRIGSLLEVGTGFHPEMTGRENIYLNGTILGMTKSEIDRKLDEIIDFSGCERYIDTPVKRYSSGMMVRLGFAVAAHLEPEILIVDEVLAVGDAEFQKKAIGKMQDVSKGEGRTVLFVSHNMEAVKNLCEKGIVLKNGVIDYVGSASDSVQHYLTNNAVPDIIKKADITDKHRKDNGFFVREIQLTSAEICNDDPKNIATDEPLVFKISFVRKEMNRKEFQLQIEFFDANENIVGYYSSDLINLKPDTVSGNLKITIPKHALPKGRYFVKMEATITDYCNCVAFDSCYDVLSFEVTQITKSGPVFYQNWYPGWGLRLHRQDEFSLEIKEFV